MQGLSRVRWMSIVLAAAVLACSTSGPQSPVTPSAAGTRYPETIPPGGALPPYATHVPVGPPLAADPQGWIAFARERFNTWYIEFITPDGSGYQRVNISAGSQGFNRPAWSPEGTRLAVHMEPSGTYPEEQTEGIAVVELKGASPVVIPAEPLTLIDYAAEGPAWAPDGKSLLYTTVIGGNSRRAFQVDPASGESHPLAALPENAADPVWSPDGTRLLFSYVSPPDQNPDLFVVNADGSGQVNLTHTPEISETYPAWSPDGRRIAFVADWTSPEGAANTDIFLMEAGGSTPFRLTSDARRDFDPAWSPDGKRLAFVSDRHDANDDNTEIYLINADGTGEMRLTNNHDPDRWPSWRAPLPTDREPSACQPALHFVTDVNIPPGTRFLSPQGFWKVWRVENTGDCPWTPADYHLQPVEGDWADTPPFPLDGAIQPYEQADLTVHVDAPDAPGIHRGSWVLVDGNGNRVPNREGVVEPLNLEIEVLPPGREWLPRAFYAVLEMEGGVQLWHAERDGRTLSQVSDEPAGVTVFSLSPDGHVAFTSGADVILTDARGGNRQVIGNSTSFATVLISPDGRQVAFVHNGITLYDMETRTDRILVKDMFGDANSLKIYSPLSFSPDGSKLIVSAASLQTLTSGQEVLSTADGSLWGNLPYGHTAWSPDSQNVYYTESSQYTSFLYKLSAGQSSGEWLGVSKSVYRPTAAPDGSLYFFLSEDNGDEMFLTRTDANGEGAVRVLPAPFHIADGDLFGAWGSPDAAAFALLIYEPAFLGSDLMIYPLDGSPPFFVSEKVLNFAWEP